MADNTNTETNIIDKEIESIVVEIKGDNIFLSCDRFTISVTGMEKGEGKVKIIFPKDVEEKVKNIDSRLYYIVLELVLLTQNMANDKYFQDDTLCVNALCTANVAIVIDEDSQKLIKKDYRHGIEIGVLKIFWSNNYYSKYLKDKNLLEITNAKLFEFVISELIHLIRVIQYGDANYDINFDKSIFQVVNFIEHGVNSNEES